MLKLDTTSFVCPPTSIQLTSLTLPSWNRTSRPTYPPRCPRPIHSSPRLPRQRNRSRILSSSNRWCIWLSCPKCHHQQQTQLILRIKCLWSSSQSRFTFFLYRCLVGGFGYRKCNGNRSSAGYQSWDLGGCNRCKSSCICGCV